MAKNKSYRKGTFLVLGIIALGYLIGLFIFSMPDGSPRQYAWGGSFMVALGVLWSWGMGRPLTFRLDRERSTFRLVRPRGFFEASEVESLPLEHVRGVLVNEVMHASHDGPDSTYYEVRLEAKNGRAVSLSLESSRRSADRLAARLRSCLKDGGGQLTVRRIPWLMLSVGAGLVIIGALLILSAAVA